MKTSAALRFLLVLIIGGAGIAAIGVLYKHKQAREPVWLEGDQAVQWERERLPLKVWLDPELAESYTNSLKEATGGINTQAGCALLAVTEGKDEADVQIIFEPCEDKTHAGCAYYSPVLKRGFIKTGHPGDIRQAYILFEHELGHVLGLAHDGYVAAESRAETVSVMSDNAPELAGRMVRLTTKDASALRERYCR